MGQPLWEAIILTRAMSSDAGMLLFGIYIPEIFTQVQVESPLQHCLGHGELKVIQVSIQGGIEKHSMADRILYSTGHKRLKVHRAKNTALSLIVHKEINRTEVNSLIAFMQFRKMLTNNIFKEHMLINRYIQDKLAELPVRERWWLGTKLSKKHMNEQQKENPFAH